MSSVAVKPPVDVVLPDWLNKCLIAPPAPILTEEEDRTYNGNALICRAFQFAYQLHGGQIRKSGEPYIAHPVAAEEIPHNAWPNDTGPITPVNAYPSGAESISNQP